MPVTLANTTTTDDYKDTHIGGGSNYISGSLLVANNPISLLLTHGVTGQGVPYEYPYITPGVYPLSASIKDPIRSLSMRAAISGQQAQVSGWLIEPERAGIAPGTPYTQLITPGGIVSPVSVDYQLLAEALLTVNVAPVDFSGIPQTHRTLHIIGEALTTIVADVNLLDMRLNGDAGANYDNTQVNATAGVVTQADAVGQTQAIIGVIPGNNAAPNRATFEVLIPNYTSTAIRKTYKASSGTYGTVPYQFFVSGSWRNTAAVNRITFENTGPVFAPNTLISIYGVGAL